LFCRKCKHKMREERHIAHGKRKFTCPKCGSHRMKSGGKRPRDRRRTAKGWD